MLPFYRGEILSEITRYEPNEYLEEDFIGAGMRGHLAYQFLAQNGGTTLIQRESLNCQGLLRLFEPLIGLVLERRLHERLALIKEIMDGGYTVTV